LGSQYLRLLKLVSQDIKLPLKRKRCIGLIAKGHGGIKSSSNSPSSTLTPEFVLVFELKVDAIRKELDALLGYQRIMNEEIYFSGDYASWGEAAKLASGYDKKDILEKVLFATLAVKTGNAVAQRDGVILEKTPHNFPLIATLLSASLDNNNQLNVLDYGGSLGSSYFDSLDFIKPVSDLNWSIVEQAQFVAAGRAHIASEELHFFDTIEHCAHSYPPSVIILSGVLQYLENPWGTLQDLHRLRSRYIFVDRTAFIRANSDRLTIQHVPGWIYDASFPAWFLSENKFLTWIADSSYKIIGEFPALDDYKLPGADVAFRGFICREICP
jgi:putative methyltransferase (TIGR04325 family)